jgi:hypothetical protein
MKYDVMQREKNQDVMMTKPVLEEGVCELCLQNATSRTLQSCLPIE